MEFILENIDFNNINLKEPILYDQYWIQYSLYKFGDFTFNWLENSK